MSRIWNMASAMPHDPVSLILIFCSLLSIGLAKGGLAGVGMIAMPLMAMVFPPVEAGAILMPLLIVQDALSVWAFRHSWNKTIIMWMMPGAIIGGAAAAGFAYLMPTAVIVALLGLISIIFGLWRLWLSYHKLPDKPLSPHEWPGTLFGFLSGFTSQIAHAGAPPFQMWVVPKRLPHVEFVGTSAVLFALVNWVKVPAFISLSAFTRESLIFALLFLPLTTAFTFCGIWLVKRIKGDLFYTFVNVMLVAVGIKLVWDAFF